MDKLKELSKKSMAHWTAKSYADFVYQISADFILQIEKKLEKEGIKYNEFAALWGVSPGRVSQVINDPGNLELVTTVQCARAIGMKVALVAYEDGDPENRSGPINSEIFSTCWERAGAPRDFFELSDNIGRIQIIGSSTESAGNVGNQNTGGIFTSRSASTYNNLRVN